jgi:hypothetical protein
MQAVPGQFMSQVGEWGKTRRFPGLGAAANSPAGRFGIIGGGVLAASQAVPALQHAIGGNMAQGAISEAVRSAPVTVPYVMNIAKGEADNYLRSKGVLNNEGQVNVLQPTLTGIGDKFKQWVSYADPLLKSMGMDPTRLSTMQKAIVLGGGALGAGGFLTGHPWLGAAGTAAFGSGYWPQISDRFGGMQQGFLAEWRRQHEIDRAHALRQQATQPQGPPQQAAPAPGTPVARNEWDVQRQLQQPRLAA